MILRRRALLALTIWVAGCQPNAAAPTSLAEIRAQASAAWVAVPTVSATATVDVSGGPTGPVGLTVNLAAAPARWIDLDVLRAGRPLLRARAEVGGRTELYLKSPGGRATSFSGTAADLRVLLDANPETRSALAGIGTGALFEGDDMLSALIAQARLGQVLTSVEEIQIELVARSDRIVIRYPRSGGIPIAAEFRGEAGFVSVELAGKVAVGPLWEIPRRWTLRLDDGCRAPVVVDAVIETVSLKGERLPPIDATSARRMDEVPIGRGLDASRCTPKDRQGPE